MGPDTLGQFSVTRKAFVPTAAQSPITFVRYLEIMTNNGSATTRDIRIGTASSNQADLGCNATTAFGCHLHSVSSTAGFWLAPNLPEDLQSSNLRTGDVDWIVMDDANYSGGADLAVGWVVGNPGASDDVDLVSIGSAYGTGDSGDVFAQWENVPFAAGETKIIMTFIVVDGVAADAATDAAALTAISGTAALSGMSATELSQVINFNTAGNALPTAVIASPSGGASSNEPGSFALSAVGSTDSDGTIATYEWDCANDGTYELSSSSPTGQSCAYANDTNATIALRVTDNSGGQGTATVSVSVPNVAPTITTVTIPGTATVGVTASFAVTATDPADGLTYTWDFGDGGSSTVQNPSHTYTQATTRTVTVTVFDDDTSTAIAGLIVITSGNNAPVGSPSSYTNPSAEGGTVAFIGSFFDVDAGSTHTYLWDFGDGTTSNAQNPSHTYVDDGSYTASFTVTDNLGASDTDTFTHTVNNVAPTITSAPVLVGLENTTYSYSVLASDPGTTDVLTWTLSASAPAWLTIAANGLLELTENVVWHARVRAEDELGAASAFDTISFFVLGPNDAPGVPLLLSPEDGLVTEDLAQVYVISHVDDPEDDDVAYEIRLSTDAEGTDLVEEVLDLQPGAGPEGTADQTSWPTELSAEGTYYWTARAVDAHGAASDWADVFSLTVGVNDPPPSGCAECESSFAAAPSTGWTVLALFGLLGFRRRRG